MRFWDSSALVSLHVQQVHTRRLRSLYREDPQVVAWVLSDVEVRSALCRLGRDGALAPAAVREATARSEAFWTGVQVVSLVDAAKLRAKRLLGTHALGAADAMQLGAALTAAYDDPADWEFVCLDQRLADAARLEGFVLLP